MVSGMSKISVVMPCYNHAQYTDEAIQSMLTQTEQDFELILVDDGSKDNCAEILLSYRNQPRVSRIILRDKAEGTAGPPLNDGFALARGQYRTWVSNDNGYEPQLLEVLSGILDSMPNVGFVYSDFDFRGPDGVTIQQEIRRPPWTPGMFIHGYHAGVCFMWRTELALKTGPQKNLPAHDYEFALRMEELADMYHVEANLGWWRNHEATVSAIMDQVQGQKDLDQIRAEAIQRRIRLNREKG